MDGIKNAFKIILVFIYSLFRFCKYWLLMKINPPKIIPAGAPMKAKEGYVLNPFLKYPRNTACYCGSGKKYKVCCLDTEPGAIPKEAAEIAAKLIKQMRKK